MAFTGDDGGHYLGDEDLGESRWVGSVAIMILDTVDVPVGDFERSTGWTLKPEGACRGPMCVPLRSAGATLDARVLSERLGMPLLHDERRGLWALGPPTVHGRALESAEAPDWAHQGAASRYVLSPKQVVARSRPRGHQEALAATHFELGCHLQRLGDLADAQAHFKEAHRLQPENWTYKCQAWSFVAPDLGPSEAYDTHWASEVERTGVDNYYPPLEM